MMTILTILKQECQNFNAYLGRQDLRKVATHTLL